MYRHFLLSFFVLLSYQSFSQAGLDYVRNFGGTSTDMFRNNILLRNGNLVSVGYTESTDGHGTGNHGDEDCLAICTSPDGVIIWKKVLGGTQWDGFSTGVDTTTDGNVVIAFTTGSNDGDITGNHGGWDIAFFKYTPDGTLLWKKTYGGSEGEVLGNIQATPDGGLIALASTGSSATGNVTGTNHGSNDLWVFKVDVDGNLQWQRSYGGSLNDVAGGEGGSAITLAADGGYFFSTSSNSVDGDLAGIFPAGAVMGANDIWLCHINATGNILWSKNVGGNDEDNAPKLYSYGNTVYLLFSTKSSDRDLQGNAGSYDMALFRYSTAGALLWKKQYASSGWDVVGDITGVEGDLITISGGTYSFQFAGFPLPSADERMILFRVDTLNGAIKWMKGLGGNGRSQAVSLTMNKSGEIFVSGLSTNTTGDIYANIGDYDAVVLRFAASNRIKGTVFIDANNNNIADAGEERPNHLMVRAEKGTDMYCLSSARNGGQYNLEVDTGMYKVYPDLKTTPYYTATPPDFSWQFSGSNESYTKDIPLHAVPNVKDLAINLVPVTIFRPGREARYILTGYNVGTTTIPAGTVGFKKDPTLGYISFSPVPDYQNGDSIAWNFSNLEPFDSVNYFISILPPPSTQGGIIMNYLLAIRPVAGDAAPANNTVYFRHIILNSYDPNCKSNNWADSIPLAAVQAEEYIYYTIQFQNTGTASAIDIFIKDTLSDKLRDSTMEIVKMSHPGTFSLKKGVAAWTFFNINLPDSNANEKASHGYIQFRIKPKKTLVANDFIDNTAAIYFDFNPPVITDNNRITVYVPPVVVQPTPPTPVIAPAGNVSFCSSLLLSTPATAGTFQWYKDEVAIAGATANTYNVVAPGSYTLKVTVNNISSNASAATIVSVGNISEAVIAKSGNTLAIQNPETGITYTWQILNGTTWTDITTPAGNTYQPAITGDYRVRSVKGMCTAFSALLHAELPQAPVASEIRVYPIPASTMLKIDHLANTEWETLSITDATGKKMITPVNLNSRSEITINVSNFAPGVYFVILRTEWGTVKRIQFVKQ